MTRQVLMRESRVLKGRCVEAKGHVGNNLFPDRNLSSGVQNTQPNYFRFGNAPPFQLPEELAQVQPILSNKVSQVDLLCSNQV